jgi:hypothetical protein
VTIQFVEPRPRNKSGVSRPKAVIKHYQDFDRAAYLASAHPDAIYFTDSPETFGDLYEAFVDSHSADTMHVSREDFDAIRNFIQTAQEG